MNKRPLDTIKKFSGEKVLIVGALLARELSDQIFAAITKVAHIHANHQNGLMQFC